MKNQCVQSGRSNQEGVVWFLTSPIGWYVVILMLVANQASCQVDDSNRLKNLSGTYFIQDENQIAGNIKRRVQLEEDAITDNESMVSILSDGQEVFSGRRRTPSLEVSGIWHYVHSAQESKMNGLQADRSCTVTVNPDGEGFTLTMRSIRVRPKGGLFANMLTAIDQGSKGVNGDAVAESMQWEIVLDKQGLDTVSYIRKKTN